MFLIKEMMFFSRGGTYNAYFLIIFLALFIPNTSKEKVIRTAKFASDPLKIQKEIKKYMSI